ncbi:hypothetical protein [Azohydromonas australica]|uniref:hypothetical protein n=1 Tax=Azohydromonas australica TaxID=364039 RepID=UPI0012EB8538|nr:hypothetical protein [Azohydromonas australica]
MAFIPRRDGGVGKAVIYLGFDVPHHPLRARTGLLAGPWLSLWDSHGLSGFELRPGGFNEEARGRWYFNVCVSEPRRPCHPKPGVLASTWT